MKFQLMAIALAGTSTFTLPDEFMDLYFDEIYAYDPYYEPSHEARYDSSFGMRTLPALVEYIKTHPDCGLGLVWIPEGTPLYHIVRGAKAITHEFVVYYHNGMLWGAKHY